MAPYISQALLTFSLHFSDVIGRSLTREVGPVIGTGPILLIRKNPGAHSTQKKRVVVSNDPHSESSARSQRLTHSYSVSGCRRIRSPMLQILSLYSRYYSNHLVVNAFQRRTFRSDAQPALKGRTLPNRAWPSARTLRSQVWIAEDCFAFLKLRTPTVWAVQLTERFGLRTNHGFSEISELSESICCLIVIFSAD